MGAPFYRQAWHGLKHGSANMGLHALPNTVATAAICVNLHFRAGAPGCAVRPPSLARSVTNKLPDAVAAVIACCARLQVLVGAPFYHQAWHGLKYGSANMGLLVALGTTAAFADSLFSMALAAADPSYQGHVYFESSVLILVFVCAGKYIEAKAKARTSDAVRGLLQLGAKSAVLLTLGDDGESVVSAREIPAELIQVNFL